MIKYRKAKLSDAKQIGELLKRGFRIDSAKEGVYVFKQESETGHTYYIAEDGNKIVGAIAWRRIGLPKHMLGKITRFTVADGYEKIQETLFKKAVQELDKEYRAKGLHLRKIYLNVHANNKMLQKFYEKVGLIKEATLKDHFYKGIDEYMYSMFFE